MPYSIFGNKFTQHSGITELMDERTEILSKQHLSDEDKLKVDEIDSKIGYLPVGETKYQREAYSAI